MHHEVYDTINKGRGRRTEASSLQPFSGNGDILIKWNILEGIKNNIQSINQYIALWIKCVKALSIKLLFQFNGSLGVKDM